MEGNDVMERNGGMEGNDGMERNDGMEGSDGMWRGQKHLCEGGEELASLVKKDPRLCPLVLLKAEV